MISFKVKVSRFKKQTINLPTSWSELTLEQWNKIKSLDESQTNEIFKILIDSDLNVNPEQLLPYMEWIAEPLQVDEFESKEVQIDVFGNTYQKKIQFQMELAKGHLLESIPKLLTIYLGKNEKYYLKMKISESLPLIKGVIQEFEKILIKEQNSFNKKTDPDEILAGIESLNVFSHFNTIDEIAKQYNYTHEEVEQLPFETVYLISYRKHILFKFENKLREIKSNK